MKTCLTIFIWLVAYVTGLGVQEERYGDKRVDPVEALKRYQVAAEAGDHEAMFKVARLHFQAGRLDLAGQWWESALVAKRDAYADQPQHPEIADTLHSLGNVYLYLGDYTQAKARYTEALKIKRSAYADQPVHSSIADTITNLGLIAQTIGDFAEAKERYQDALEIYRNAYADQPNHPTIAKLLSNLGIVYDHLGDFAQSLYFQEEALAILRKAYADQPHHPAIANVLNNLGIVYSDLGDYAKARERYEEVLTILGKVYADQPNHPSIAMVLSNLATVYENLSDFPAARERYESALGIFREAYATQPNHPSIAQILGNLGIIHDKLGEFGPALQRLEEALSIYRKAYVDQPQHSSIAETLTNLGSVYRNLGDFENALLQYREALVIFRYAYADQPNHPFVANLLHDLGVVADKNGQLALAIFYGKAAVNTLQGNRDLNKELQAGLQKTFFESKQSSYRLLADWLVEAGRFSEAQLVLGMLKEQEYMERLKKEPSSAGHDARDVKHLSIPLSPAERKAYAPVKAMEEQLQTLFVDANELMKAGQQSGAGLTMEAAQRLKDLNESIPTLMDALSTATARMAETLNELVDESHTVTRMELDDESYFNILVQLESIGLRPALLSYIVRKEGITWFLLRSGQTPLQGHIEMDRAELNQKVFTYYNQLADPRSNPRPLAREFHDLLVAQVQEILKAESVDTLILTLDGTLRHIPFASLHDGDGYMVERYRLVRFSEPSISTLSQAVTNLTREQRSSNGTASHQPINSPALAVGVSEAHAPFKALPGVPHEIDSVLFEGNGDQRGVLRGRGLLDRNFTLETFNAALNKLREQFRQSGYLNNWVLHVATHFSLDETHRGGSFLLLGDGERLSFDAIANGALNPDGDAAFAGVNLLVLSACDTAVGQPLDDGRSIDSLAILAHKEGAAGVMATLWPVIDVFTPAFVESFYKERFARGQDKAAALRLTQLAFLSTRTQSSNALAALLEEPERLLDSPRRGRLKEILNTAEGQSTGSFNNNRYPGLSHPAYWAPFVLIGDFL